jgi:SAM-dependent methyltransferase
MTECPDSPTARTIAFYDRNAPAFRDGTWDHDVSQNYAALLDAIVAPPPWSLLDFGCGPGRDLRYFRSLGHDAVGLDGSARFADMARRHSGAEVWVQDFTTLDLPAERFDGIFANASLFHVPREAINGTLTELWSSLKPSGILFCSNPRGNDEEGDAEGRFGVFYREETWLKVVQAADFQLLRQYYRPAGKPRAQQPWFATVWRKVDRRTG